MRGVCKAPQRTNLACKAPSCLTLASNFSSKRASPAHVAPLGKSSVATSQTAPGSPSRTARHEARRSSRESPATESTACGGPRAAASCSASARALATLRPSSKSKTPAANNAVSSPAPKPATAPRRSAACGSSRLSFSRAAAPAMYNATSPNSIDSSLSPPSAHTRPASHPRTWLATRSCSATAGNAFASASMPAYCEPCPGNSKPTPATTSNSPRKYGRCNCRALATVCRTSTGSRPEAVREEG
mmetsp:Transcript_45019/g.125232  ORF Transcript_45019/g.125232 Transcript_45019/m.125232 type:complete len:245 (-) Transcript_45019:75-809(-)